MTDPTETTKSPEPTRAKGRSLNSTLKANEKRFQDAAEAQPEPTSALDIVAPSGGQLALTAHNNLDGTWSITRGPGGSVLREGLPREQALAIVGAPTNGEKPANEQEAWAAEQRRELEEATAEHELKTMFKSDAELSADDTGPENA